LIEFIKFSVYSSNTDLNEEFFSISMIEFCRL